MPHSLHASLLGPDDVMAPPTPPPRGPVAIVTGSNTGIGLQTARQLCARGYHVVVAARDEAKGRAAAAEVAGAGGSSEFARVDLASLASTDAFCAAVRARFARVHALVLNAGITPMGTSLAQRCGATDTGYEACFQVNFLAQFELTRQLLPLLQAAAAAEAEAGANGGSGAPRRRTPVRLVTLSSLKHWLAPAGRVTWADAIAGVRGADSASAAYGMSKLAAVLFARELQSRLDGAGGAGSAGIECIAVNPGAVNSDIWRALPPRVACVARPLMGLAFLTPAQGAATSVAAAADTALAATHGGHVLAGGDYLTPYYALPSGRPAWLAAVSESVGPFAGARRMTSAPASYDEAAGRALWAACDAAVEAWRGGRRVRGVGGAVAGLAGVEAGTAPGGSDVGDVPPPLVPGDATPVSRGGRRKAQ